MRIYSKSATLLPWGVLGCANLVPNRIGCVPFSFSCDQANGLYWPGTAIGYLPFLSGTTGGVVLNV